MVVVLILAAFLAGSMPQAGPAPAQQDAQATELGEVVVEGRRTREAAEAFVRSVAAPVRGRKLALWRESVCVGVGGMQPGAARFMADRISDWAASVGLRVGAPGCRPRIFVMAAADGDVAARALVASRPREFRTGVADSDQGAAALAEFQTSGRLIRWWHISLAVDGDTGAPVRRLPGQPPFVPPPAIRSPADLGAYGRIVQPSRLTDDSRDDLAQVIIVLDTAALDRANFVQITDYVAMVALAQIDPETEPAYPSILRLFKPDEAQEAALTRWDQAYLDALYEAPQNNANTGANLSEVAAALTRNLLREGEAPDDPASPN